MQVSLSKFVGDSAYIFGKHMHPSYMHWSRPSPPLPLAALLLLRSAVAAQRLPFQLEHAASTCSMQSAAEGQCSHACCSHCAPCPIVSIPRSVAPRSHTLAGALWPGREAYASAVRMLTLSVLCLSTGSRRPLDYVLAPEKGRSAVIFLEPPLGRPARPILGSANFSAGFQG